MTGTVVTGISGIFESDWLALLSGICSVGKAIARYAPLVGALGVGAYAYYDTQKVADTANELFSSGNGAT